MEFSRLSKNKAKELRALHNKKTRDELGLFLAEGKKCVSDLLKTFEPQFILTTERFLTENPSFLEFSDKILTVNKREDLHQVSTLKTPAEIIAIFRKPVYKEVETQLKKDQTYLLLDDIQDPGNMGTIIRTCDWFGIYDIYASRGSVDIFNPKVVQSTMGSLCRVKVNYTNLEKLIENNSDLPVYGTMLEGVNLATVSPERKGFIIMGNEGKGISDSLQRKITLPLTIPPANLNSHPDSLNVAIATAIILSHFQS